MTKLTIYTKTGSKSEDFKLPKYLSEKPNLYLLAQAIRVYEDGLHPGLSKVKTRGEVRLSTRKIYRQKGTGGARHGAKSAPIFVGGGVAHGPNGIKRKLSLNKVLRKKALQSAFSNSFKNNQIVLISGLETIKSTKEANQLLKSIELKFESKINSKTIVISGSESSAYRFLKNLKNVKTMQLQNVNAYKIYFGGLILLSQKAFAELINPEKESPKTVIVRASDEKAVKKAAATGKVKAVKKIKNNVSKKSAKKKSEKPLRAGIKSKK